MRGKFVLPLLLLFAMGCVAPQAPTEDSIEKVAEDVKEEAATPAEEPPVPEPPSDMKSVAQNLQVVARQLYQHEQAFQTVTVNLSRLNFIVNYLGENSEFKNDVQEAEAAWQAHLAKLQEEGRKRAAAEADAQMYKAQVDELTKRLEALEGKVVEPVPPEPEVKEDEEG